MRCGFHQNMMRAVIFSVSLLLISCEEAADASGSSSNESPYRDDIFSSEPGQNSEPSQILEPSQTSSSTGVSQPGAQDFGPQWS